MAQGSNGSRKSSRHSVHKRLHSLVGVKLAEIEGELEEIDETDAEERQNLVKIREKKPIWVPVKRE